MWQAAWNSAPYFTGFWLLKETDELQLWRFHHSLKSRGDYCLTSDAQVHLNILKNLSQCFRVAQIWDLCFPTTKRLLQQYCTTDTTDFKRILLETIASFPSLHTLPHQTETGTVMKGRGKLGTNTICHLQVPTQPSKISLQKYSMEWSTKKINNILLRL